MATGIGGDVVAIIAHGDDVDGLDAAGAAPAGADPESPIQASGACSVTVPGAVPGWAALADRYGRLGLDRCLSDAIDVARRGFAVMPRCAHTWAHRGANCPPELQPCPTAGEIRRASELADTLEAIAGEGSSAFYTGQVAAAIASVSWLTEADLAACRARWVAPLRHRYRDHEVIEPPPPTQGIAALEALALLDGLKPTLANQIRCTRLALQDALARVHDGAEVQDLLAPAYLHRRRAELSEPVTEPAGGTVYLCAVDQGRMAVSLTQSLYAPFGSGVIAPGTGVLLQNRAACFGVHGRITPGRRPYHTPPSRRCCAATEPYGERSASSAASSKPKPTSRSSQPSWTITWTPRLPWTDPAFASTATFCASKRASTSTTPSWPRSCPASASSTTPSSSGAAR